MNNENINLNINKENSEVIFDLFTDSEGNLVKIVFKNNESQIEEGE